MKKVNEFIENERTLMDLEYEFVKEFVNLRKEKGLSQQQMADNAHVIRETISRIETLMTSPQVNTLIKILEPVGYTIKIVKIDDKKTI